jgi:hypothetical protein
MPHPRFQKFTAAVFVGLLLQGCQSSFHVTTEESSDGKRAAADYTRDSDGTIRFPSGSGPLTLSCEHSGIRYQGSSIGSSVPSSSLFEDSKPTASATFPNSRSESGSGTATQSVLQVRGSRSKHGYEDRLALEQSSRARLGKDYRKQLTLVRSLRARLGRECEKKLALERALQVHSQPIHGGKPAVAAAVREKPRSGAPRGVQMVDRVPAQCLKRFDNLAQGQERGMQERACRPQRLVQAFGVQEWERYFGEVGVEPPLPADIVGILHSSCPFWPGKQIKDTHLLVLIPSKVNGEPFTLNLLRSLIQSPRRAGYRTQYRDYDHDVQQSFGNRYPLSPYWVLITRDVLPGSRFKTCIQQEELVAAQARRTGMSYKMPRVLEITTAILSNYACSGERLYTDVPWTYTRCQEMIPCFTEASVFVGGFSAGGLSISDDFVPNRNYGVSSLLRF